MVKLKKGQEAFTVVDGSDAGRTFKPDMEYDQAPEGYENRFKKVKLGVETVVKTTGNQRSETKKRGK